MVRNEPPTLWCVHLPFPVPTDRVHGVETPSCAQALWNSKTATKSRSCAKVPLLFLEPTAFSTTRSGLMTHGGSLDAAREPAESFTHRRLPVSPSRPRQSHRLQKTPQGLEYRRLAAISIIRLISTSPTSHFGCQWSARSAVMCSHVRPPRHKVQELSCSRLAEQQPSSRHVGTPRQILAGPPVTGLFVPVASAEVGPANQETS